MPEGRCPQSRRCHPCALRPGLVPQIRGKRGTLLSDGLARLGVSAGQQAEIGREPNCPASPTRPSGSGEHPVVSVPCCPGGRRLYAGSRPGRARQAVVSQRRRAEVAFAPSTTWSRTRGWSIANAPRPVASGGLIVAGTSVIAVREPGAWWQREPPLTPSSPGLCRAGGGGCGAGRCRLRKSASASRRRVVRRRRGRCTWRSSRADCASRAGRHLA